MARTAQRRRKRPQPHAPKKRRSSSKLSPTEQTMFFPRLRQQAKWVFVLLALAFAVGFVVFNVGSGGGGTGIGDLLLTPQGASDAVSAKEARERIAKNANDAEAYRELGRALETEGDIDGAIDALETYTALRAKDADAKRELAGLYLSRASRYAREAQLAQASAGSTFAIFAFLPDPSSQLGQALGQDPITEAVAARVNERVSAAETQERNAYTLAMAVYRDLIELAPRDQTLQLELAQTAEGARDYEAAAAAYERFLELAPDDSTAPAVRERLRQLRAATAATG